MPLKFSPGKATTKLRAQFSVKTWFVYTVDVTLAAFEQLENKSDVQTIKNFVDEYFMPAGTELQGCHPGDWVPRPKSFDKIQDPVYRQWAYDVHSKWRSLCRRVSYLVWIRSQFDFVILSLYIEKGYFVENSDHGSCVLFARRFDFGEEIWWWKMMKSGKNMMKHCIPMTNDPVKPVYQWPDPRPRYPADTTNFTVPFMLHPHHKNKKR